MGNFWEATSYLFTARLKHFLFWNLKGFNDDIKCVVIRCKQRKLFKENEGSGEHKHTINNLKTFIILAKYSILHKPATS